MPVLRVFLERDEAVLVTLAQSGDMAAFEQLLRQLHMTLRRYVTTMVGASTQMMFCRKFHFASFGRWDV